MAAERPNPAWWLYYQYGGTLPGRFRAWVLHDGTCRTWFLRVVLRALVQLAPIVAILVIVLRVLLGGPWLLVLGSILLGVLVFLRIALTLAVQSIDARLARYGYPAQHGTTVRRQAAKARDNR